MVAGVEIFGEYLQDSGLMDWAEFNAMQGGIEQALQLAFEGQRGYQHVRGFSIGADHIDV
jgi:hypothetical protein